MARSMCPSARLIDCTGSPRITRERSDPRPPMGRQEGAIAVHRRPYDPISSPKTVTLVSRPLRLHLYQKALKKWKLTLKRKNWCSLTRACISQMKILQVSTNQSWSKRSNYLPFRHQSARTQSSRHIPMKFRSCSRIRDRSGNRRPRKRTCRSICNQRV